MAAPLPVLGEDKPLLPGSREPTVPELQPLEQGWRSSLGQYLCQSAKPHLKAEPTGCVNVNRHQPTRIMIFKARSFCYQDMLSERQIPLFSNLTAVLVPPWVCANRREEQAERRGSLPACPRHFQRCRNRGGKWRKESWVGNKVNPEPSSPAELLKAINMKNTNPMLGLMCLRQLGVAVYTKCSTGAWREPYFQTSEQLS